MIDDPLWPRADRWLATDSPSPDLAVIGVPTSSASLSPSEAWRMPAAFREGLGRFSTWDSEDRVDIGDLSVADRGDWAVEALDMHGVLEGVADFAGALDGQAVHAFIGGDNAITRPLVRGLSPGGLDRVGVLTLDAHHDVRSLENGPTNGTPIRGLIEDGLPGRNVTQVGIHSFANSGAYRHYCEEQGIEVITMAAVDEVGAGWLVATALDDLAERSDRIFVDVDMDVLDIAFAPGCPGARPGGMTPRQLASACRAAGSHPAVMAVDFVEADPGRDPSGITTMQVANAFLAFCSGLAQRRSA
ncbi:MAG TPA: agmatinase family protein [Acidimicrobiia bacterium]|nr:agmatinase family protein [Acidimicrobiia bacterium]